jgi:DNA-binding NtrC family response regulator
MDKILVVDDEQSVRYSFKKLFSSPNYKVVEASNSEEAFTVFNKEKPNLVILDIEMPGMDGIQVLKEIKRQSPSTNVIIITAYGSGDRVINAMKYGAYEYIEKPFDVPRLMTAVDEALKSSHTDELKSDTLSAKNSEKADYDEHVIIGQSPAIKDVFKLIGKVATSDASILIVGESGTGKELVARAIHKYSDRVNRPFIAVNCAAIPETLLESELFGYERGAFTGADRLNLGKFEEAHNGTLFLDEVGDMSLSLQSKFLRVLQEGKLERLGSSKTHKIDVRIVAATNRSLENDIIAKRFREDLYYRLKVVTISLPPLRMRIDDIPVLSHHFLQKHAYKGKYKDISLHPEALKRLIDFNWPGNIRQLENVIKRAAILSKGNIIYPDQLFEGVENPIIENPIEKTRLFMYLTQSIISKEGEVYKLSTDEFERDLIEWAISKTKGNQVKAAKLLGISRVMIHERLVKFGLLED